MEFMELALRNAQEALELGEVPVGCVFLYDNQIIAKASNRTNESKNGTRHAELNCIDTVLEYCKENALDYSKVFKEVSVIVTVEPCIMCAAALHELGIKEVVFGCKNDRFGGTTVLDVFQLLNSPVKVQGGVRQTEAMDLLKEFYKGENPSAPVSNKKRKSSIV